MEFLWNKLTEWLKEMLVGGVMSNLTGLFDSINDQVSEIAGTVGKTPQGWNSSVFSMVQSLSNNVVVPIAGILLAIVMAMELIQMIVDRNNMNDFELGQIVKWVFKSFFAVIFVTSTWDIVMGIFDLAQAVVNNAAGVISSDQVYGDGDWPAVQSVDSVSTDRHSVVGFDHLHICDRVWAWRKLGC